jgi:cell division protein ZapE
MESLFFLRKRIKKVVELMDLLLLYREALEKKGYQEDAIQRQAMSLLQNLLNQFESNSPTSHTSSKGVKSFFSRWFSDSVTHKTGGGVYLWGGVGRGKSFVMDTFFEAIPTTHKTRIHFHEFMSSVHARLRTLRGKADPIDHLADELVLTYQWICFDEFHVNDIADAMILQNILQALLSRGVYFVMTSNDEPDRLYENGLHRDRFLPTIALIKQSFQVFRLDAGIDYRKMPVLIDGGVLYLEPINDSTQQQMEFLFDQMIKEGVQGIDEKNTILQIKDRPLPCLRQTDGVVWFDFSVLCGQPRSHEDYLEIIESFHTLFLSNIPRMSVDDGFKVKRFIWLVDVCYDHAIRLVIQADSPLLSLYQQGLHVREFERTISRLTEMGTPRYWEQSQAQGKRARVSL